MLGHRAVESVIEDNDLRRGGHQRVYSSYSAQMTGVVDGCQVAKVFYSLFHLGRNDTAIVEFVATLHDAMTHGIDLFQTADGPDLTIEQGLKHEVHTLFVVGHVVHDDTFFAIGQRHFQESLVQTNTFYAAGGKH